MPVLVPIVDIRPAMILEVAARAFHSIVESLPLKLVELARKSIPLRRGWRRRRCSNGSAVLLPAATHQMLHCAVITSPEPIAISFAHIRWDMGVPKFVAILHVGSSVVIEIVASSFNPVVKSLTLKFVEFLWRSVPSIPGGRRSFLRDCNLGQWPGR
jgi:hypothetical protein